MKVVALILGFITFVLVWWMYSNDRMNRHLNDKKQKLGYQSSIRPYRRHYILPLTTFCLMILCLVPAFAKEEIMPIDKPIVEQHTPRLSSYSADMPVVSLELNFVPELVEIAMPVLEEPIGTIVLSNQVYQVYVVESELIFVDSLNHAYHSES